MNISLKQKSDVLAQISQFASEVLTNEVVEVVRLDGGRNSQIYKIRCVDQAMYVAKVYFQSANDKRQRLGNEFFGLHFLWNNGIRSIAQPIAMDENISCALYEFIKGEKMDMDTLTIDDVERAVGFLFELDRLKGLEGSERLIPASEAYFSVKNIVAHVERRLTRLTSLEDLNMKPALKEYLYVKFEPFLKILADWAQKECKACHIDYDKDIMQEQKILSPSDFGFHNALRSHDRQIIFLDFEYFGWDDPAKTISDFILHPAMYLKEEFKNFFVQEMVERLDYNVKLKSRLRILYPIFGLKWCLIFLNEFIPNDLKRREFAGNLTDRQLVQQTQLEKAQKMLIKIQNTYKDFPYARA